MLKHGRNEHYIIKLQEIAEEIQFICITNNITFSLNLSDGNKLKHFSFYDRVEKEQKKDTKKVKLNEKLKPFIDISQFCQHNETYATTKDKDGNVICCKCKKPLVK